MLIKRLLIMLFVGAILLSACQTATPVPPTATVPPAPTSAAPVAEMIAVFELVAEDGSVTEFTLEDLMELPVTSGQAGIKSSTGKITAPETWSGVALKDLVAVLPGFDETMGVSVEADDGYAITFSYDQIMNGTFIQYDPGTGDELKSPVPLTAILAYELNDELLDANQSGNLRLAIVSDEPKQVTDGHWSVKFVTKVVVKSLGEEWFLQMDGAISETMDRATFESGASPNCHTASWTDDKAQEWRGIPLWLMVGRVDDEIIHEGPAYNDQLAEMGYTVDIISSDGYTVSIDSSRMTRNDNIIVAHLVNGNPLPEKYFPLRLVGSDLEKSEMAGMITKIVVHVEGMTAPAIEADLAIGGMVKSSLAFTEADLRSMDVVHITAEHPKKGSQEYEGVYLNALLEMAGIDTGATKLVLTASDEYSAEVPLADVSACADCLVAFTEEAGVLNLVMPGMATSAWIKDIVKIDVQGEAAVEIPADADLVINGLVATPMGFKEEDLRALEVVKITAEHPKKGPLDYEGVRLNTLLELVKLDPSAVKLVLTASDGFTAEIFVAEATACADCLVAFTEEAGVFNLAMPGLPSNTWMKDITKIEIQ